MKRTDAHMQDFVANYEFPLPTQKTLTQCTRKLHATRNVWCFRSVCSACRSSTICRPYQN